MIEARSLYATWQARESRRLLFEHYPALPWVDYHWFRSPGRCVHHFAHRSLKNPSLVAYTESERKGARDIQTAIKPGKYLTRFYSDVLDSTQIASLAATFNLSDNNGLNLALTPEAIENVYLTGPHSCMAYESDHYNTPDGVHPVSVYGDSDLALAYMVREDKVTARAICWPDKMIHTRIFGDEARLSGLLHDAGYSLGKFYGARIRQIEFDGGYVCPYIDYHSSVEVSGSEWLVISSNGHLTAYCEHGNTNCGQPCTSCGDMVSEDDGYMSPDGEQYCETCYSDNFGYCNDCNESYHNDLIQYLECADSYVCDTCAQSYPSCDDCGETFNETTSVNGDSKEVCNGCLENNYSFCESCSTFTSEGLVEYTSDSNYTDPICPDCITDNGIVECASCPDKLESTLVDNEGNCENCAEPDLLQGVV